jgi:uncharacterized membrane protein YeaQ/YmgE (transglycosylase-associated protein family)
MSILAWIVVGILAGVIAKALMPGSRSEPGSFLGTMLLGIVGAIFGGWISSAFFNAGGATGINLGSIFIATIGAALLIGISRLFRRSTI